MAAAFGRAARWIGGVQQPGESVGQAIVRILAQHCGMRAEITSLVGIYRTPTVGDPSDKPHHEVTICMRARPLDRRPALTREARWFSRDELDAVPIDDSTRLRITHGFDRHAQPYIDARRPPSFAARLIARLRPR